MWIFIARQWLSKVYNQLISVPEINNESFYPLLISTHEIFNISESEILKFNYIL